MPGEKTIKTDIFIRIEARNEKLYLKKPESIFNEHAIEHTIDN